MNDIATERLLYSMIVNGWSFIREDHSLTIQKDDFKWMYIISYGEEKFFISFDKLVEALTAYGARKKQE